jgi:hypothetical protein
MGIGMLNAGETNSVVMGSFSNSDLKMTTNSLERIRVSAAGLVGINTSSK